MANAINFVKSELPRQATESLPDSEAKKGLLSKIDYYIQERIIASDQLITTAAVEKIADNDVVLTYACSYVVEQILIEVRSLRLFRHLLCFKEEGKKASIFVHLSRCIGDGTLPRALRRAVGEQEEEALPRDCGRCTTTPRGQGDAAAPGEGGR